MSWLLRLAIRVYWLLVPDRWKRRCLFRVSCSRQVYADAERGGFLSGIGVLRKRIRQCRPGFGFIRIDHAVFMVTADGTMIPATEIAPALLDQCRHQ
jgi:uncharacterized protein